MRCAYLIVIAMLGFGAALARADVYTTFDVSAGFESYDSVSPHVDGSLSGTVVIDETLGTFVAADLMVVTPVGIDTLSQLGGGEEIGDVLNGAYNEFVEGSLGSDLELTLSTPTLVGYAGGAICGTSLENCPFTDGSGGILVAGLVFSDVGVYSANAYTGELTPIMATPEPGSVALLGTGVLGFVQLVRRRRG